MFATSCCVWVWGCAGEPAVPPEAPVEVTGVILWDPDPYTADPPVEMPPGYSGRLVDVECRPEVPHVYVGFTEAEYWVVIGSDAELPLRMACVVSSSLGSSGPKSFRLSRDLPSLPTMAVVWYDRLPEDDERCMD